MIIKSWLLTMSFILLNSSFVISAEVDKLVESCNHCHGKDGISTMPDVPSIAGMSTKFLASTYKAYKAKERTCLELAIPAGAQKDTKTDMCKIIETLSADDLNNLNEYYAAKKFVPAVLKFDADLAAKGKEIHKINCEKCHNKSGTVAADHAGFLGGQQTAYLEASFKEYLSGKRPTDKKMKKKFDELDKESLDALIQFYASFK